MDDAILSIIVVAIFLTILVVLFSLTARRVNALTKKNFVDKLQQYDFLIDEKEKKVRSLDGDIATKKEVYKELEEKIEKMSHSDEPKKLQMSAVAPQVVDLEDGDILEKYKEIKTKFDLNVVKKIKKFIKEHPEDEKSLKKYTAYMRLRVYFGFKTIYKISTYQKDEQKKLIKDLVRPDEWKLIENLMKNEKKFDVNRMMEKIDMMIINNDPNIYVYVPEGKKDYGFLGDRIVTKNDKRMTEGMKIVHRGVVYDYSI